MPNRKGYPRWFDPKNKPTWPKVPKGPKAPTKEARLEEEAREKEVLKKLKKKYEQLKE